MWLQEIVIPYCLVPFFHPILISICMSLLRELLFFWSYLCFPFILWMVFRIFTRGKIVTSAFFLILSLLFVWMRFIEPQLLITRQASISFDQELTIALLSDMHLWVYRNNRHLSRVVAEINTHDVAMVLIAWDLTLDPKEELLAELLSPLRDLQAPTFSVLWNHDVEKPWPEIREILVPLLEDMWVRVLNNDIVFFSWFNLVGLWAHSNQEDDITLLQWLDPYKTIVLTHNPDTTLSYSKAQSASITFAWHTHCWQIRIPSIYKVMIPTVGDFDKWLTQEEFTQLYITCWVWETGLPLRFLNPPVIDIITLGTTH